MRDLVAAYDQLSAGPRQVGRAVVTSVWGSAPRAEGAAMLATKDGTVAGSVSGGCVESAAAAEIAAAIERGSPRLVTFGVSHEEAWAVGLACGGTIRIFVEPRVRPEILDAARGPGGEVIATIIDGPGTGAAVRVCADGRVSGGADLPRDTVRDAALAALRREASGTITLDQPGGATTVFLEVFPRQPRLVIVGATHVAAALVPLARRLGYRTIVADGRAAFLTPERFPEADALIPAWPEEAFDRIGLDGTCYVCVLSHDPKFDEPALRLALRSPAGYIGALGSRKTQAERRERLAAEGFTGDDIGRIHGPIGLDLGGRAPAETALAILAEMTRVRYGRETG
jgi:xanthine dehydrogenase accessory factor